MLIAALLPQFFSDFVPIAVVLFGGGMLVIIVLIHDAGLDRIVARNKRAADMRPAKHKRWTVFNAPMEKGMSR